jgi:ABC-type Fe3+/spermidine/putrescine transport system ATPase subunit
MQHLLQLLQVTKNFGKHSAVQAFSLEVPHGESVALLGPSGCGKTTVLRLIAGLEEPDAGEIWIAGRRVANAGGNVVPSYQRGVGLVFQDLALWPHLTVRQNLAFVVASTATAKRLRAERIDDALRRCRVDLRFADRYPHELSGGEQQRVALARALVGTPRLLMLDEPFSSLDRELKVALRTELVALRTQLQLTMIYVTHDQADAEVVADRTVAMRPKRSA